MIRSTPTSAASPRTTTLALLLVGSLVVPTMLVAPTAAGAGLPPQTVTNVATGVSYATLQAAVDAAAPGATLVLTPGTFASADINKPDITLCAADGLACADGEHLDVIVRGGLELNGAADGATIRGLRFTGSPFGFAAAAIELDGASRVTIRDNVFENTELSAISFWYAHNVTIENNRFVSGAADLFSNTNAAYAVIRGNTFVSCVHCVRMTWNSHHTLFEGNEVNLGLAGGLNVYGVGLGGAGSVSRGNVYRALDNASTALAFDGARGSLSENDVFEGPNTGIRVIDGVDGASQALTIRNTRFVATPMPLNLTGTNARVDARLVDWGVPTADLLPTRVTPPAAAARVLQVPFMLPDGTHEPAGPRGSDASPTVCNALDADADGFADAYHDGARCIFLTLPAAMLAAKPGDTIAVPMSQSVPPLARMGALQLDDADLTLCATTPRGTRCVEDATPGDWLLEGAAWAPAPSGGPGQALRIEATDGTFGIASVALPAGTTFANLRALGFDAYYGSGGCVGGSPRYHFDVDTDGDGASDKAIDAYAENAGGCALGAWTHHDLLDGVARFGLQPFGGPWVGTRDEAAALAGPDHQLLRVALVWDSSWAFPGPTEVSYYDDLRVGEILLMEPAGDPQQRVTDATILDGSGLAAPTLEVAAPGVTVSGLTVRHEGADAVGIQTRADSPILRGNVLDGAGTTGMAFGVWTRSTSDSAQIVGNIVRNWANTGIYVGPSTTGPALVADNLLEDNAVAVRVEGGPAQVSGNTITRSRDTAVAFATTDGVTLRDNIFRANAQNLEFFDGFPATIDARANDWGVLGRDAIALTFAGSENVELDFVPYYDAQGRLHPPMVVARCQERADGSTGSVDGATTSHLDIQDALDAHACPAWVPSVALQLAADAEAYDGATVARSMALTAARGARILATADAPGLAIVEGSGRTFVSGATFDVTAGATGLTVDGLSGEDFAYVYESNFVGQGAGIRATNGNGPAIQFTRFAGVDPAVRFDGTVGGNIWSDEFVANPLAGAAPIQVVGGATDTLVRANHLVADPLGVEPGSAILVHGAVRPDVTGNIVRGNGAPGSLGLDLADTTDATVHGNLVQGANVALRVATSTGSSIRDNRFSVPPVNQAGAQTAYGISLYRGAGHTLAGNTVAGGSDGLLVHGAPDVRVTGLAVIDAARGVTLTAGGPGETQPTGFTMAGSTLSGTATPLELTGATALLSVMAECNDWGAYSVATIRARIHDSGVGNRVDFEPYTSADSDGLGCLRPPTAAFESSTSETARGRPVTFTDESAAGSRPIVAWRWDFGDGSSLMTREAVHAYDRLGSFLVTLTVTDVDGMESSAMRTIDVVNHAPVLAPIGPKSVLEGTTLTFRISASDAEGDAISYEASDLPAGATFDALTRAFEWAPGFADEGAYPVRFVATDGELASEETVLITVTDSNRAPVLAPIGNQVAIEGTSLTFLVGATDADGDALTLAVEGLPAGATFDATTGVFEWTPAFGSEGNYVLTFTATDGEDADAETITISVGNVDRPPVLDPVGDISATEGQPMSLQLTASDPDATDVLSFHATDLPAGATLADGLFLWTPTFAQAGAHTVTFVVSDGELADAETVTITVANVDRAPTLSPLAPRQVLQLTTLRVPLQASDPDGDAFAWSVSGADGAVIEPGAGGAATLVWTPTLADLGAVSLTVVATSGPDQLSVSQPLDVQVNFKTGLAALHETSSFVRGSPGEVVTLVARFTNTGPQTDTFALNLGMSALWTHTPLPASITLASGESRLVSVDVTIPNDLALSYATVSATSVGNASVERSVRFRLDVPVVIALPEMDEPAPGVALPSGRVRITHLDGTPAAGALVTVTRQHGLGGGLTRTSASGAADDAGTFAFDFSGDPRALVPGKHQLVIVAKKPGGFETTLLARYDVGPSVL